MRRADISDEDAIRQFYFVESVSYQAVLFILPIIIVLILFGHEQDRRITDEFVFLSLVVLLLNFAIALHYRLRRHSLAAWIPVLFVPLYSLTALLGYLLYLSSSLTTVLATRLGTASVILVGLILWATGFTWSTYGNGLPERKTQLLQAFQKRALSLAETSRLLYFPRTDRRPWGKSHHLALGTFLTSMVMSMRSTEVDSWYQQIPNVASVILGCSTALMVGLFCGFVRSLWPMFHAYGDITIIRTPKRLSR